MDQQQQIQSWKDQYPEGPWGFAVYNSDIQQMMADNPDANGIRLVFGIDENGVMQAFLEPANLPQQKGGTGGGILPCPTYCS